jgi:GntR family transcriptional regulator
MVELTNLAKVLRLDPTNRLPLYQQLERALRSAIEEGVLAKDDPLPPERQLAEDLSVSRITVRKAIDLLATEGYLVKRQGAGNFVRSHIDKSFTKITSFSEDMRARGRVPRSVWLLKAHGLVSPDESLKLGLSPATPVYRYHRVRFADDSPMCVELATVVASFLPALDCVEDSLYDALERAGNRPTRALQRLRAVLLNTEQAHLLNAKPADAGLLVERLGFLADGRAVELAQSCFRGDTYDFVAELSSSG